MPAHPAPVRRIRPRPAAPRRSPARSPGDTLPVRVGRRVLEISKPGKVLYPRTGFTKADVVDYYLAIAPALLPHLRNRALTMKRYPDGVDAAFFYEKNCPPYRPGWMPVARIPSTRGSGATCHCVINEAASLVWVTNLADLELHVGLARVTDWQRPTAMVFDLDPGEGAGLLDCAQVALWLREGLRQLSLEGWPKTSGNKGIQVYVPINTATTYERTSPTAHSLARILETAHPDRVVTNMRKDLRRGKVLIDWSQNDDHKTTVCVYSLRATPEPSVSTPVEWKEISAALRRRDASALRFSPAAVLERVRRRGDLFAPVLTRKQPL